MTIPPTCSCQIDVVRNRLNCGDRTIAGSHRWEALTLALLVQAGSGGLACSTLQAELQRAGQRAPLDRTGLRRLFVGIQSVLDSLLGEGAFEQRLRFMARHFTVGPWALVLRQGEVWEVIHTTDSDRPFTAAGRLVHAPLPAIGRLDAEVASAAFTAAEYLFKADALFHAGKLKESEQRLRLAIPLHGLTQEGQSLLKLRLARLLKRQGRYDEADEVATEVACSGPESRSADPAQGALARQLARRIRYDRAPCEFERLGTEPLYDAVSPMPDMRGLAEAESLQGLIARRRAIGAAADGRTADARALLIEANQRTHAALYWAASLRDYENSENFAFNIGLVQASMHDILGDANAVVAAFRAYRLGLLIRDHFSVGQDSVWDHVFIAELWLDHPARRDEFEVELAFDRLGLSDSGFYVDALDQARAIGDARQLALCCVNLWRFAKQARPGARSASLMRQAKKQLREIVRHSPELMSTLSWDASHVLAEVLGD